MNGDALVEQFEHSDGGRVLGGGVAAPDKNASPRGRVHDGHRDGRVVPALAVLLSWV